MNTDSSFMFLGRLTIENIYFDAADTSGLINATGMFQACTNLTELDLTNFDTRSLKYVKNMFRGCTKPVSYTHLMFTDLTEMKKGDLFYIHVVGKILAYKVDEINVVLPEDTEKLNILRGEDHVTLITCTPYGVNSHRLLVRGRCV